MGMEDFGVLWVWGFPRVFLWIWDMGMGLKSNFDGSPDIGHTGELCKNG